MTAHGIAYDFCRFLRRPLLAFKAVEYLVGRDPQRLVMHRFLPELAQLSDTLLARPALVRPVAQRIANDFADGSVLASSNGAADDGDVY